MRADPCRAVVAASAALIAVAAFTLEPVSAEPEGYAADGRTIENWMNGWMPQERQGIGTLHLGRFSDPIYFLRKPITWKPNPGQEKYQSVTVPIGFVTDFASIPRIFWSLLPPTAHTHIPPLF